VRLLDTNLGVYAANDAAPQHTAAREAIHAALAAPGGAAMAWNSILGFLRLTTQRGVLAEPIPIDAALGIVQAWLNQPTIVVLHPGERHAATLGGLLRSAGRGGNLVNDAHLAALAIEHGATLVSFDRDFERFAGLRFEWLGGAHA
jgi:toxin-antitoxin system PIN domain toxin